MGPVVASTGTVAFTVVDDITVTDLDVAPLNVTDVVPARLLPAIVTTVFTGPLVGVNDVMIGAGNVDTVGSYAPMLGGSGLVAPIKSVPIPAMAIPV